MEFIDTHCHIHSSDYGLVAEEVIKNGQGVGVNTAIVVGTDLEDSHLAVKFSQSHENIYSSIGLHPHEAKLYVGEEEKLNDFKKLALSNKVVAIGECGLDYHYKHSSDDNQKEILRFQLNVAKENNLPLIFHVREAFDDFWHIFDEFKGLRGVIHSFSASNRELDQIMSRGLYIGLNGIMTFTKNQTQLDAAKAAPLNRIVLETDSPFLTPAPHRGTIAQLKHVTNIADFLAKLREESIEEFSQATTNNAKTLFNI